MKVRNPSLLAALTVAGFLAACGGSGNDDSAPAASGSSSSSSGGGKVTQVVDGWAAIGTNNLGGTGTTGGEGADAAHTYTVTNRSQLIMALYPNAVIAADGSFTVGGASPSSTNADATKKIIYVSGTIDLNVDGSNVAITEDQYLARNNCLSTLQAANSGAYSSITTAAAFWTAYKAAYAPNVWNTTLVSSKPPALSGPLEVARSCASGNQSKIVRINVGSNTSLIGVGSSAKIVGGNLALATGANNIVIRNITFEDSFDYWPAWDPTDSFPSVSATPAANGCSTAAPTKCVGGRWNSNYDLISVTGATHVWIDHVTLSDGTNIDKKYPPVPTWDFGGNPQLPEQKIQHHDGLIDVNLGSHYVTLSYNHFKDHDKTGLIGGTDSASLTESPLAYGVTIHHNYYQNNKQRQPRARFGRVHVYNNYFSGQLSNADGSGPDYGWMVAWTAGTASKLYIENNVIELAASPSGDTQPAATHLAGASSSVSNYTKCTSVASKPWANTDCVTTFYDNGNLFNGVVTDVYTGAGFATTTGQPIVNEKTATTKYWQPSTLYNYTLDDASAVKAKVLANAGVGKL